MGVDQTMFFRKVLRDPLGSGALKHIASAPASPDLVALLQKFNPEFLFETNILYTHRSAKVIVDWLKVNIATQLIKNSCGCREPSQTRWV